jgi:hypothetical protein
MAIPFGKPVLVGNKGPFPVYPMISAPICQRAKKVHKKNAGFDENPDYV